MAGLQARTVTVVGETAARVPGAAGDGRVAVDPAALEAAVGWTLKERGLCRGDVCVPVRRPEDLWWEGNLDVAAVAAALGRPCVVDADAGMAALGLPPSARRGALVDRRLPPLRLPDLDGVEHDLDEWAGRKRLLVAFASWCGCRYDLPGWQALQDELADDGLTVVAVALDDDPADVAPFTDGITMPVLVDRQHLVSEALAISNVPTVVWVDEEGGIARPNGEAFGSDLFADFTGVAAGPHLDLVRQWVHTGAVPPAAEAGGEVEDLSDDEVAARLHFRLGAEARRAGDADTAARHLARASALAPLDFSVRRAAMPLQGEDPFGQDFLDLYDEWQAAGRPYHGRPPVGDSV